MENAGCVRTIAGNFYPATYNCNSNDENESDTEISSRSFLSPTYKLPVTLLISSRDQSMGHSKNQFSLSAALSFQDDADCLNKKGIIIPGSNGKETVLQILLYYCGNYLPI